MKFLIILISALLVFIFSISDARADVPTSFMNDIVLKIKEDDDGKLVILKNATEVLYLTYETPDFDAVLSTLTKSQTQKSPILITTDHKLNVLKAYSK